MYSDERLFVGWYSVTGYAFVLSSEPAREPVDEKHIHGNTWIDESMRVQDNTI